MVETIWYRAPSQMFSGRRALLFFPTASMTVHAQLNAIMRFCVYYSLAMVALTMRPQHLLVAVLGAIVTVVISEIAYKGKGSDFSSTETLADKTCYAPDVDNPHMNFRVFDPPDKAPACKPWDVEHATTAAAGEPLQDAPYQKPFDRFYTMPSTTVTNDQKGFAEWLYGSMPGKSKTPDPPPSVPYRPKPVM